MDLRYQLENALWLACDDLLIAHTNPWELDEALTAFGFSTGPCEVMDHVGLLQVVARTAAHRSNILPRMTQEGRVGKIGGVGYYRYPGGGGAVIDPLIEDLMLEEAWFYKVKRTELSDAQLVDYVLERIGDKLQNTDLRQAHTALAQIHFPMTKVALLGL